MALGTMKLVRLSPIFSNAANRLLFFTVMLGYGFSINNNPFDHYTVGFRVPPGSALEEARALRATQSLKANKKGKLDDQYRYYVFNADHPRAKSTQSLETSIFSQDLFDSISVLSANIRELQSDTFRSTGSVLGRDLRGFKDTKQYRNLLHTLCQLRLECSSRSLLLRANAPRDKEVSTVATTPKQQYTKIYRDSQLLILETAALLCRYCLLKAQNPEEEDNVLISCAAASEQGVRASEATTNVQKLVHRTPATITFRALFDLSHAIELLPAKLALQIRDAAQAFGKALRGKAHLSFPHGVVAHNEMQEKINFAVLLAALRKVYSERSVILSAHLKLWMGDVQTWYPFDDPFWNGPTEDFLPTLETLIEAADHFGPETTEPVMAEVWSNPHMLCWGWNVQEEEGLFSDTELLQHKGGGVVCQPSKYLLYISEDRQSNGTWN
jgi:hypothetical protein